MRKMLPAVVATCGLTAGAAAGPLEDGVAAHQRLDFAMAFATLSPLATSGQPEAQYFVGAMYLRGEGVALNAMLAARWLRLSAEAGDRRAQRELGRLYLFGRGVRLDTGEAARWFSAAALRGDADAQQCLASLYAMGLGVPQDEVMAFVWYSRAVDEGGGKPAERARDAAAARLTPAERARASVLLAEETSSSVAATPNP
jgi:TPR repeat protein